MNETATWTGETAERDAKVEPRAGWAALVVLVLILVLCFGASAWMIWEASRVLFKLSGSPGWGSSLNGTAEGAALLKQFNRSIFGAVIAAVTGGVALVLAVRKSMMMGQGGWKRRLQIVEEELAKKSTKAAFLEEKLSGSRKSEEQLERLHAEAQKRAGNLEVSNSLLQGELDKLKRTEKTLAQHQQVLESSKAVLELHVQARTKELQKLQRRYEHILNSAGEGICGLDPEGKTIFANPAVAKITGWPLEELIGKTEQEIFWRNGATAPHALTGQTLGEQLFYRKDGTVFTAEFVKTSINESGSVVGAVLVFKDITERKRVEDALAQKAAELSRSNAELEQFAFVASHDLQEPLRKIQAFGDRLKTKCEGLVAPDARDYLQRMQNAATRMRQLIDDLLAFSRAIRSTEAFASVDLGTVAKEVLGDLEVRIEKSGARVEVGPLPTLEADPMQMRQLMLNLIGNALKFQAPGSSPLVRINGRLIDRHSPSETSLLKRQPANSDSAPMNGGFCEITIADNGIGFDEQYSEKIFAVFQRLHGRGEYEGSGVGLAVCRRIADRHHGTIVAKSKVGEGSTFIVTLPTQQPKPDTKK